MSASFCCDRCGAAIPGNRSVLAATRGELAVEVVGETALIDGFDLCKACVAGLLDWLRSGHQAGQLEPSVATGKGAVGIPWRSERSS
jgi:hypothetical protein